MAKHYVKCYYCGEKFDANEEEYVMINSRRYAHKKCAENKEQSLTQEQLDKIAFEEYVMKIFKLEYIEPQMQMQIKRFIEKNNFTYSGMRKALIYFYEVKGNPIEKAGKSLGIIPYAYQDAYRYYFSIWQAQQRNQVKEIKQYIPQVKEIIIPIPQLQPKKERELFKFLDEEQEKQ